MAVMVGEPVFPPVLRIRVTQGEHAGQWLENLGVSQGAVRVMPINMGMVLKQPARYTFHPKFTDNERAACKPFVLEIADGYLKVLKSLGIAAEIVVGKPADQK